jgi:chromosome segregation ATPase
MGLFRRRRTETPAAAADDTPPEGAVAPADPGELERAELAELRERIDAFDAATRELDGRVRGLHDRLSVPISAAPAPALRAVEQADVDRLRAQVARADQQLATLDERLAAVTGSIAALDARLSTLTGSIAALDARVSTVSSELANQITELGAEIDALGELRPVEPASPTGEAAGTLDAEAFDALVDELRDAQVRLANEQARYQIAFRQDLAELVERLRRPAP